MALPIGRIIRYGIIQWIVGIVIGIFETNVPLGHSLTIFLFYFLLIVVPLYLFGLYFVRSHSMPTWRDALVVGIMWIVIFTILNVAVFVGLGLAPLGVYFSWQMLLEYLCFLAIGVGVAYAVRAHMKRLML